MNPQTCAWSLEETSRRILGDQDPRSDAVKLLPFIESERLVPYEQGPHALRRMDCSDFERYVRSTGSVENLKSKAAKREIVFYPAVCAPDAPTILAGKSLREVMLTFILGDPELDRWSNEAIAADPKMESFIRNGHYHPAGSHEWSVVNGTLDDSTDYEYAGSSIGILVSKTDFPNPAVRRVRLIARLRFGHLMQKLSLGQIEAVGDPARSTTSMIVLRSIWTHGDYHIDVDKNDVVQTNQESTGRYDQFRTRWSAVLLQRPLDAPLVFAADSRHRTLLKRPAVKPGRACQDWLEEQMRAAATERPKSKDLYRKQAMEHWSTLSDRAFDRAWSSAIDKTGAAAWSRAGRPAGG